MTPKHGLARLLRIKAGDRILLADAPEDFQARLAPLPHDISFGGTRGEPADAVCLFVVAESELVRQLPGLARRLAPQGRLWVFWPRPLGATVTDVTDEMVRGTAAAAGLADRGGLADETDWNILAFMRTGETDTPPPRGRT